MDEEVAASVFKPFVSVGKENGTGLGLIVVSDAVLELGGTITVTSVVNEGTTFDIIIPGLFLARSLKKY
jgi:signal transduction histidine kinase